MDETLDRKLRILADAAKYDASCASSGAPKRSAGPGGLGSTDGAGICHAYTPDGRCVSLLKILLTNYCLFDCAYCINRRSSNVARARFSVEEVVSLTLEFYKRNYIEGLFLSSGIIKTPDGTMEEMVRVARTLRQSHDFAGYIHLKTIPEASPWLIEQAGLFADRLSINLELPQDESLSRLAPEKKAGTIRSAMGQMQERIAQAKEERRRFSPAGQSTQIIVGADTASDAAILTASGYVWPLWLAARVLFRLQSHFRGLKPAACQSAAADAGKSPLSGGLVAAPLRIRRRGNRFGWREGHAGSGHRSQAGLGIEKSRYVST
jgi:putative DNA modification/repair radical SAM protein